MSAGMRRSRETYGAPVSVSRRNRHQLAEMPWPSPCAICRKAARWEVDGRRLCKEHMREEVGK